MRDIIEPTYTDIKSAGLKCLKGRWPEAIVAAVTFIAVAMLDTFFQYILMLIFKVDAVWSPFAPTTAPTYNMILSIAITLFSAIFTVAVILPLFFGVMRWFWMLTGVKEPELSEMFYYFSKSKLFFKTVAISFGFFFRAILGVVICFLPYIISEVLLSPDIYNFFGYPMPIWLSGLFPLKTVFEVLGFVLFLIWVLRYCLIYVVVFSQTELSAHAMFKKTAKITKGRTLRFIGFTFSFTGWYLLSLLIIPMIFTVPFALASFAIYGREEFRIYNVKTASNTGEK